MHTCTHESHTFDRNKITMNLYSEKISILSPPTQIEFTNSPFWGTNFNGQTRCLQEPLSAWLDRSRQKLNMSNSIVKHLIGLGSVMWADEAFQLLSNVPIRGLKNHTKTDF